MSLNCIILDDYQNVTLSLTNCLPLEPEVHTRALTRHIDNERRYPCHDTRTYAAEARLTGRLPHLKLSVTSGMNNAAIDLHACAEHCIVLLCAAPPAALL